MPQDSERMNPEGEEILLSYGKNEKGACAAGTEAAVWVIQLALFLISVGALLMGAHNPFIYFNF